MLLRIVADGVNSHKNKNNAFLIITHYQRLLDYIKPDFIHVLSNGKIIKTGCADLGQELEKTGYRKFKIMEQLFNIDLKKYLASSKKELDEKKNLKLFLEGGLPNKKMKIGNLLI